MSWVINSTDEPIVVMPASELITLIAGDESVCAECAMSIARHAEKILPHPWSEAVSSRVGLEMDLDAEDEA